MRETSKMRLTLLLPTAMTHTHSLLVTQGCFPLNPAPSCLSQHPAKADPLCRSPPSPENAAGGAIFSRFPDTRFFCSAKKTPWLDKGQKAVAEQIGIGPFCEIGMWDEDGMKALRGLCKLEREDGRAGSTRMDQAAAGAAPLAWRGC